MKTHSAIFSAPFGKIGITVINGIVNKVEFLPTNSDEMPATDSITKKIIADLKAYFKNPDHEFSSEYFYAGTEFQRKVWKTMLKIPRGKTLTYGQVAKKLDTGPRAVGQACRTNPVPLFVPCHRIVAQNGQGGFAGQRHGEFFAAKAWLLRHEGLDI